MPDPETPLREGTEYQIEFSVLTITEQVGFYDTLDDITSLPETPQD